MRESGELLPWIELLGAKFQRAADLTVTFEVPRVDSAELGNAITVISVDLARFCEEMASRPRTFYDLLRLSVEPETICKTVCATDYRGGGEYVVHDPFVAADESEYDFQQMHGGYMTEEDYDADI